MKLFRNNQFVLSDKLMFYTNILRKALVQGTDATINNDDFIEAELTQKWETEHPQLVEAWKKNNEIRQQSKKRYDEAEQEILRLITPVPGALKTPADG